MKPNDDDLNKFNNALTAYKQATNAITQNQQGVELSDETLANLKHCAQFPPLKMKCWFMLAVYHDTTASKTIAKAYYIKIIKHNLTNNLLAAKANFHMALIALEEAQALFDENPSIFRSTIQNLLKESNSYYNAAVKIPRYAQELQPHINQYLTELRKLRSATKLTSTANKREQKTETLQRIDNDSSKALPLAQSLDYSTDDESEDQSLVELDEIYNYEFEQELIALAHQDDFLRQVGDKTLNHICNAIIIHYCLTYPNEDHRDIIRSNFVATITAALKQEYGVTTEWIALSKDIALLPMLDYNLLHQSDANSDDTTTDSNRFYNDEFRQVLFTIVNSDNRISGLGLKDDIIQPTIDSIIQFFAENYSSEDKREVIQANICRVLLESTNALSDRPPNWLTLFTFAPEAVKINFEDLLKAQNPINVNDLTAFPELKK